MGGSRGGVSCDGWGSLVGDLVGWGGGSRDTQHAHFRDRLRRKISPFYQMYRRRRRPKKITILPLRLRFLKGFCAAGAPKKHTI